MKIKSNERIRIGVAGAGNMGQNHIRVLSELENIFDLVGVYDPIPERARIADKYGIKSFSSYEKMLAEVQAVTLPCPTSLHYKLASKAADSGVHALVEKPAAENLEDAREMYRAFYNKGLKFAVGQVERFNPVIKALAGALAETEIVAVEIHRCSPFDRRIYDVDVVSDLMIHDIDIVINALFDKMPMRVEAFGKKVYSDRFVDYAQAVLTFNDGVMAFITSSRCTEEKIRTVCIHTKGAYIEGDMLNRTLTIKRGANYDEYPRNKGVWYQQSVTEEQIYLPEEEPLKSEMADFGKAIMFNHDPLVDGHQVARSMSVLDMVNSKIYNREEL